MAEKRRKFDPEFRKGAVRIVAETGKTVAEVAEVAGDPGINGTTLASWVSRTRRTGVKQAWRTLSQVVGVISDFSTEHGMSHRVSCHALAGHRLGAHHTTASPTGRLSKPAPHRTNLGEATARRRPGPS